MMKYRTALVPVLFCAAFSLKLSAGEPFLFQKRRVDKVIAVKTVKGRTVGFETGDYQHVTIKTVAGKTRSFFIWKPGLDYFLAVNKARPAEFTYEIADATIPESGGVMRIERMVSAKVGDVTYEQWWKEMTGKNSVEQLDKKFGPLIEKFKLR